MTDQRPSKELVHKVCGWICQEIEASGDALCSCKECPLTEDTPYGPGSRFCILRAKELIEVVRTDGAAQPPEAGQ